MTETLTQGVSLNNWINTKSTRRATPRSEKAEITHSIEFNDLALDREGILELCPRKAPG